MGIEYVTHVQCEDGKFKCCGCVEYYTYYCWGSLKSTMDKMTGKEQKDFSALDVTRMRNMTVKDVKDKIKTIMAAFKEHKIAVGQPDPKNERFWFHQNRRFSL